MQSVAVPSIQIAPRSLPAPVALRRCARDAAGGRSPAKDERALRQARQAHRDVDQAAHAAATRSTGRKRAGRLPHPAGADPLPGRQERRPVPLRERDDQDQRPDLHPGLHRRAPSPAFRGVLYRGHLHPQVRARRRRRAGVRHARSDQRSTELEASPTRASTPGDIVGQSGLEAEYNQYLQGVNGAEGVKVNSQGQFEGYAQEHRSPTTGDTLKLSLNAKLEQVGQQALARLDRRSTNGAGGAFVAMDPQNGQIYAMGSAPTYNPSKVSPTISNREWAYLSNPNNQPPLLNRAIQSPLPDGSTFKVITADRGARERELELSARPTTTLAKFCFQGGLCLQNSGGAHYGVARSAAGDRGLRRRLLLQPRRPDGRHPIDAPATSAGRCSSGPAGSGSVTRPASISPARPAARSARRSCRPALWNEEQQCETATGPYAYTNPVTGQISSKQLPGLRSQQEVLPGGCGIASAPVLDHR